ncbi:Na+/H+ antiporter subunit E [Thermobifida halotolerans]|uniref:Na+/H+ antiporter subunit E n=1 Tax=Thermobifida halotolerans TaxID=483545 RepID=A0A399FYH5_9ACTN|nr:Na+/H+ antiporter subunit E [Thermobifida halotolerans]UOE19419.1 Na+/H+ antiporter subunit E [Thermobifida halotolerans]
MTSPPVVPDRPPWNLRIGRRVVNLPMLALLTAVWVLLFGDLSPNTVAGGLLVGLVTMLVFPLPPVAWGARLRPAAFAVFLGRFAVDLVLATARVVAQTLAFGRPPRSSVIAVPLRTRSDLLFTLTAVCVSVIPGSVIVEVRSGTFTLFVHMLGADAEDTEEARRNVLALEERVVRAFGTRSEIERMAEGGLS